ncbi:MAG TPA: hypothetical protein VH092_37890, partial [Urbifossiella sp.]|nr:hypothetical protein [Urbifossiella sp.]
MTDHPSYRPQFGRLMTGRELDILEGRAGLPPAEVARYVAAWSRPAGTIATPPPAAPKVVECPHRSPSPTGEVECLPCGGRTRLKVYSCAVHGTCVLGAGAAGHRSCAGCKDNPIVRAKADPWGNPVVVPEPPPLALTPTSPRAVVTAATGAEGNALLAVSGPWLRAYAKRLRADLIVLTDPLVSGWGQAGKFGFWRVLERYDRAAFIDADTVADPHACPDLFGEVPEGFIGIYDDLPGLLRHAEGGALVEEYQRLQVQQGYERSAVRFYGNTGVIVADRGHRDVFAPPAGPIPPI